MNDLTDADVLIHVVDASGMADTEGNQVGEGVHPLNDLAWIRNELLEWIYGNVACKWAQISRKGKDKVSLYALFKSDVKLLYFSNKKNHILSM